jgi:murein DD-endopeptidase MepM/ murein hydrolase activator NlpD
MQKKKRKVEYISFIVVPDNEGKSRSFRLKVSLLKAGAVVVLAILVGFIVASSVYWIAGRNLIEYTRLKEENFELRKGLAQMEKIKEDLQTVRQFGKKVKKSLSGYMTITPDAKQDSLNLLQINFSEMSPNKQRTIFNSIPSYMPVNGFLTRRFESTSVLTDAHLGIDIAAPSGTPVHATADGVVMFSGWTEMGGYTLIIQHSYGFFSLYKHNQMNLVTAYEHVTKGQVIARLGNTGKITSGAHLHFEIWKNGLPVDPILYINDGTENL